MAKTYADKARANIPSTHLMVVVRMQVQRRRIRLVKAAGMEGVGLGELSEKQLVEKANLALALMTEEEENRPTPVKFMGANKERGSGGVTFELNSEVAAGWLREEASMAKFLSKMGSTADFKE